MNTFFEKLKNEPVRLYNLIVGIVGVVAILVPALPAAAMLAVLVPLLGLGEVVRSQVTPSRQVFVDRRELIE